MAVFIGEPGFAERDERFAERAFDLIDPLSAGPPDGSAHREDSFAFGDDLLPRFDRHLSSASNRFSGAVTVSRKHATWM
ncbi:MAG: hypothetical protein ABSF69_26440 [Polyangiaceae bacterium]